MIDPQRSRSPRNKVPEATLVFWIIKILSTTVGETGADYLAMDADLGPEVTGDDYGRLLGCDADGADACQGYVPWKYWRTLVLISVIGTSSPARRPTGSR